MIICRRRNPHPRRILHSSWRFPSKLWSDSEARCHGWPWSRVHFHCGVHIHKSAVYNRATDKWCISRQRVLVYWLKCYNRRLLRHGRQHHCYCLNNVQLVFHSLRSWTCWCCNHMCQRKHDHTRTSAEVIFSCFVRIPIKHFSCLSTNLIRRSIFASRLLHWHQQTTLSSIFTLTTIYYQHTFLLVNPLLALSISIKNH